MRVGATELLIFRIGRERFALELKAVDEVVDAPELRVLPDATAPLLGVVALRERLVPLYAPATLLAAELETRGVALIMRWGQRRIALAADDAEDIVLVELGTLRNPPPSTYDDEVVVGVLWRDGELCTVLDARALVSACVNIAPEEVP